MSTDANPLPSCYSAFFHVQDSRRGRFMNRKTIYLLLCLLGIVLPYWQFLPWVAANGLNLSLFLQQLFANRIGAFFGMDVLVSAAALLLFIRLEKTRVRIPGRWLPLFAVLTVGVSLALPLFLYLRERALEQLSQPSETATATT